MIDTILDIIFWFIEGVVSLLPNYDPPNDGMIQTLVSSLVVFNQYFPVVEMVECLAAYFSFVGIYMVVRPILKLGRLS